MSSKARALRDVRRTIVSFHRRSTSVWQASASRPTVPVKAIIRNGNIPGIRRKASGDGTRDRQVINDLRSKLGNTGMLRDMEEWAAKRARPPPGHKYWGITIFRCTYGDDEAWAQLLKLIREEVEYGAEYYEAPDLADSFNLKVFEDPSVFVGASTALLRERFLEWRSSPEAEQESDGGRILLEDNDGRLYGTQNRYRFCVQVDEESLYSVIDRETKVPTEPKFVSNVWKAGHVNLIDAEWYIPGPEFWAQQREMDPFYEEPEDPYDEDEEPIEGCRLIDVGWMKIGISVFGVSAQKYLDNDGWRINYVRPPGMVQNF